MEQFHHIYKSNNTSILYAWWFAMHTRIDVAFVGTKTEKEYLSVVSDIYKIVSKIEQIGNYFDDNSELSLLNCTKEHVPFCASEELFEMIEMSKRFFMYTDGAFDVTIHSKDHNNSTLPNVYLDSSSRIIRFECEGIKIDLCGMIKGYALEKVRRLLEAKKIKDCLISFGNSSILARGSQPGMEGWSIGFSNKDFPESPVLHDECLSMSGNVATGNPHIVNPETGEKIDTIQQVAVVTKDPALGDALSTALFVIDENKRKKLLLDINTSFAQYCYFLN